MKQIQKNIASLLLAWLLTIPVQAQAKAQDQDSLTPSDRSLFLAVSVGNKYLARDSIEDGANVNAVNSFGFTPLELTAMNWGEGLARILLENGANMNPVNTSGFTPLHFTAMNPNESMARILLENGADVDVVNDFGVTPLHLAASSGNEGAARIFLENGADVDATTGYGYASLYWSIMRGSTNIWAAFGNDKDVLRIFLENEVVNEINNFRITPLHFAVSSGNENTVCILLENKADIYATTDYGHASLYWAIVRESASIVRILLNHGAEVSSLNSEMYFRMIKLLRSHPRKTSILSGNSLYFEREGTFCSYILNS